jgi:peptidoglycan/xylan/chitin deacetylase (PgdA/CDA1 family)
MMLRLNHVPLARIVIFHNILPEDLNCFEANLRFLKRKTNVVDLDAVLSGELCLERINTVITFDDGYKSWINSAVPMLKRMHLPATFFVSSGFIGLSKGEEEYFLRSRLSVGRGTRGMSECLSCEELRMLSDEGFTIGGHTVNHRNLADLTDRGEVEYEIVEDKARLEALTGKKLKYFAYPSGKYENPIVDIIDVLRESGYSGAVTTIPGFNSTHTNAYLLNRELTRASMPDEVFKARVYGNYDGVRVVKELFHTAGRLPLGCSRPSDLRPKGG